jgi:hypothetical protein
MIPPRSFRRDELRESPSLNRKTSGTRVARPSGILFLLSAVLAIAAAGPPTQPVVLPPEQAASEGKALVAEILSQKPAGNTTSTGVMTIRDAKNKRTQIPIRFQTILTPTNWLSIYEATTTNVTLKLSITHNDTASNSYAMSAQTGNSIAFKPDNVEGFTFVGSDFSWADLGLEFLHWPEQHLIKKEMKRSRSCKVLESINPKPVAGAYSRVVSWIDNESDGIVMAQAYNTQGKLLKEFIPKKVKKVEGQWQLEEMEIDNVQTDSSTRVDFDLSH